MLTPGRQARFRTAVREALAQGRTCASDCDAAALAERAATLVLDHGRLLRAHELAEDAARHHAAFAKLAAVLHSWYSEVRRGGALHAQDADDPLEYDD